MKMTPTLQLCFLVTALLLTLQYSHAFAPSFFNGSIYYDKGSTATTPKRFFWFFTNILITILQFFGESRFLPLPFFSPSFTKPLRDSSRCVGKQWTRNFFRLSSKTTRWCGELISTKFIGVKNIRFLLLSLCCCSFHSAKSTYSQAFHSLLFFLFIFFPLGTTEPAI